MLFHQVTEYIAVAARSDNHIGRGSEPDRGSAWRAAALGRELRVAVFGNQDPSAAVPPELAELSARPEDRSVREALAQRVADILDADPAVESAVVDMLISFFRQEVADGNNHALLPLANQLADVSDFAGARTVYQQAAGAGDPDIAGQALLELSHLEVVVGDNPAAEAAIRRAIAAGHPQWAPTAKLALADILSRQGDLDGACRVLQQMIDDASPQRAAQAALPGSNTQPLQGMPTARRRRPTGRR